MQPHPMTVKFCDLPGEAFDLFDIGRRVYLLAQGVDLFVYVHARLAHGDDATLLSRLIDVRAGRSNILKMLFFKRGHSTFSKGTTAFGKGPVPATRIGTACERRTAREQSRQR